MSNMNNGRSNHAEPICHIFTPIGMLGYGFDEQEMHTTLERLSKDPIPTALILDSGSTDGGPKKLAIGDMTCPRSQYKRDLGRLLRGVHRYKVPLLIGSAGGAGTNQHVENFMDIIDELSRENGYSLKAVQIYAEIAKDLVSQRLLDRKITGCGSAVPQMEQEDIDESRCIVAQMGPEPYLKAMKDVPDFDIIVGGRAYDPAPYIAYAESCLRKIRPDHDAEEDAAARLNGGIAHAGKIMECGALCAVPKNKGAVSTIYADGSFDIVPTDPSTKCTALSVASHTLYEKSRPDLLHGPGGWLDLTTAKYEELPDGRTVRVRGSTFHRSVEYALPYQVKLEAARNKGFRSMYMGMHKDPILISQIHEQLDRLRHYVRSQIEELEDGTWDIQWHIHGLENSTEPKSIFLIGECRAKTQELANAMASIARTGTVHASYPGQKATSGNFAFGIGAMNEIECGPCSEFCIYHLMDLEPGEETSLFPITTRIIQYDGKVDDSETDSAGKFPSSNSELPPRPTPAHRPNANETSQLAKSKVVRTINDVAKVLRSKNAGPYEVTFDILFDRQDVFDTIKASGLLSQESIASLYGLKTEEVIWCGFFDQAIAFKATIPRKRLGQACANGGYMEDDVHGSQMYIPLMELELPQDLQSKLVALLD